MLRPEDDASKCLVLDGQQRFQSLLIGLKGYYNNLELHFDLMSGVPSAPDDIRYRFKFLDKKLAQWPFVSFKSIIDTISDSARKIAGRMIQASGKNFTEEEIDTIEENINRSRHMFRTEQCISFQKIDSIDSSAQYSIDDVVEVFIRANSGGTRLGKSDLLFSLISSSWDDSEAEMEQLLSNLNSTGFQFDRDFVLKTCLSVVGKGAKYEVEKFRDGKTKEQIVAEWDEISYAITDVRDFIVSKTFIRSDKTLPSYLALIPLIYIRYKWPKSWNPCSEMSDFITRCLVAGAFSGTPDNLIDSMTRKINEIGGFDREELFEVVRDSGRSLELTEEGLLSHAYGDDRMHLIFALWYDSFNYSPAYSGNLPQVDHIFPKSELKKIKEINPTTGRRSIEKYPKRIRDQIGNCMLLTASENSTANKGAILPNEWFKNKPDSYLDLHLIPRDRTLLEVDRFEEFISERRKLILQKFSGFIRTK